MATKRTSSKSAQKRGTAALNAATDAVMQFLQTPGVTRALQKAARDPKVRQAAAKNPMAWLHANKLDPPPAASFVVGEDISPSKSKAAICLTIYVGNDSRWYCGRHCVLIPSKKK